MTWPNKITYSRILLIPVFVIAALEIREYPVFRFVTVAVFVAIAAGDALDGFIARRFKMKTPEGRIIDPLADKLLMITSCVLLSLPLWHIEGGRVPLRPEIATIIIARDALICIWVLVSYVAGERTIFEPTRLGRFTTFILMSMVAAALAGTLNRALLDYVAAPLSYVAVVFTIASGGQYLYKQTRKANFANESNKKGVPRKDDGA